MAARRRVLFVAEAVSLAHVARPVVLAQALAPSCDVSIASAGAFDLCLRGTDLARIGLDSIPPALFLERLAEGAPLYTQAELARYIEQDVELLRREKPDVVVGDFRLSLSVSARVAGIPYMALCNAHWSPWSVHRRFPLPDITLTRLLGPALATPIFQMAQPIAFRLHARPLNALRRKHGLSTFPDVRYAYTDGDFTLYADTPTMVPVSADCPSNHHFVGPIVWSPDTPLPDWWDSIPDGPLAYLTLGSTGRVDLLPMLFEVLEQQGVRCMTATAGRSNVAASSASCFVADYLPGASAAARADFVICNGGSATVYQALSEGRPVIGICSNMDQFLTMSRVQDSGAGICLRAGTVKRDELKVAVDRLVRDPDFKRAARRVRADFAGFVAGTRLNDLIGTLFKV